MLQHVIPLTRFNQRYSRSSSTTIVKLKNADGILNYFRSLWAKLFNVLNVRTVLENDVKESVSGVDIIIAQNTLRTHTTEMSTIEGLLDQIPNANRANHDFVFKFFRNFP